MLILRCEGVTHGLITDEEKTLLSDAGEKMFSDTRKVREYASGRPVASHGIRPVSYMAWVSGRGRSESSNLQHVEVALTTPNSGYIKNTSARVNCVVQSQTNTVACRDGSVSIDALWRTIPERPAQDGCYPSVFGEYVLIEPCEVVVTQNGFHSESTSSQNYWIPVELLRSTFR